MMMLVTTMMKRAMTVMTNRKAETLPKSIRKVHVKYCFTLNNISQYMYVLMSCIITKLTTTTQEISKSITT